MHNQPGLFRHIAACNALDPAKLSELRADGRVVAWPGPAANAEIASLGHAFREISNGWEFAPNCASVAERSAALAAVAAALRAKGKLRPPRDEAYAVVAEWGDAPVAVLDRSAAVALGIRCFGVHLNGYVRRADGLHLWVSRRAKDKEVAPGKLDNIVAGGQPAGLSLRDNLAKECGEEASLSPELAARAVPVGLVRYCFATDKGLKPDTLFCYDLEVPDDVIPTPNDDESEGFELWPVARVMRTLAETDDFKFNVPLVILDFALRHGVLTPETCPEYTAIAAGLRQRFPLPRP
jgi:hypothetical protein